MFDRLLITAESVAGEAETTASSQMPPFWHEALIVGICVAGLGILIVWLFFCGGTGALKNAPVRRNRMTPFTPLVLMAGWIVCVAAISKGIETIFSGRSEAEREILTYPALVSLELILIGVMLTIARFTFARGLKGFGVNPRTLCKDAGGALVNLVAVYPLVLAGLYIVQFAGQWITQDPEFSVESHQSLTLLTENDSLALRVLIAVFAIGIVPVFEEMLFRGFLQTAVRSVTNNSLVAILVSSFFFVILHQPQHWVALFALACGMGYAYERSGSRLRPILMHIFFNGFSVAMTLIFAP